MRSEALFVTLALPASIACAGQQATSRQSADRAETVTVAIPKAESPPPKPGRFACRATAVGDRTHVVFEASVVFAGVDANGDHASAMSQPSRAAYVITLLDVDERGPSRAQVVLEEHERGIVMGDREFSWLIALQRGWIRPGVPVTLVRSDAGWEPDRASVPPDEGCPCPSDDPRCPCDAPSPRPAPVSAGGSKKEPLDRPAFFASLGRSIELVALDTELAPRLEGKLLGDVTTLVPSANIARQLELKSPASPLTREAKTLPALFTSTEKPPQVIERATKDKSSNQVPPDDQNQYLTVTREVALGADCRFRRFAIETDKCVSLLAGQLPSAMHLTNGYSWTLNPEG